MTKLRVLLLCFPYLTDNSIEFWAIFAIGNSNKLTKAWFWKEKLVGYQVQHFGSTLLKQNLTNSSSTKRFGKFSWSEISSTRYEDFIILNWSSRDPKKQKKNQRHKQTYKKTNSRKAPQIGIKESWNPWKGSSVATQCLSVCMICSI
jgi:hypothetical protein